VKYRFFFFFFALGCASDYQVLKPVDVDPADVTDCGFTRVEDTDFYRYDCNPVFETTGEEWATYVGHTAFHVTTVLGHPFYQLWYVGVQSATQFGGYAFGYAVSDAGTDWETSGLNPLFEDPQGNNAWDNDAMDAMQVIWDADTSQYVMLYQGINLDQNSWGLGVATSPDGLGWDFLSSNPVIDLLQPAGSVQGYCWPLGLSKGVVAGFSGYVAGYKSPDGPCEAFRINGINVATWQATDNRVLRAGQTGDFDDQGFVSIATAELDGTHYMFYAGFGDWVIQNNYKQTKNHFLGMATSSDGESWTKSGNLIPVNTTSAGGVTAVAAHTVGDRIHLWITDDYNDNAAVGYFLFDPNRVE
jgi:hypothetical protein